MGCDTQHKVANFSQPGDKFQIRMAYDFLRDQKDSSPRKGRQRRFPIGGQLVKDNAMDAAQMMYDGFTASKIVPPNPYEALLRLGCGRDCGSGEHLTFVFLTSGR